MKKIGIVTYYKIYNFGSILQAYALSEKINSFGYTAEIIDYLDNEQECYKRIKALTYKNRLLTSLKSPFLLYQTIMTKIKGEKFVSNIDSDLKKKFDKFSEDYLKLSKTDILLDKNYFDGFICGSDQVWQLSAPGLHELYYLRFTDKNKRIAYAPSFGSETIPWYNKKRLKKYLSEFKALSVREDTGVKIIEKILGEKVLQVLDPVLLMEQDFWNSMIHEDNIIDHDYIIGYFIGDISNYIDTIKIIETKLNCRIILINSGKKQNLKRETISPDPIQFMTLIANAKYVLTDSLHGTEFSIVFKKDFIVFERNYITVAEQKTRLLSLLNLLNLESQYLTKNENKLVDKIKHIDFSKVDLILDKQRGVSNKYLFNTLDEL
ncbi:polysaccharide pyruvyl transferase family protein [Beduini massiliensis]|uniref:polysaccharide pyruvyl transferase family protein n=1 Tax=Beduini massiliensis TaxID=1585974 RepID=UPI00059A90FB|nr:polysaccharide pyruvyl transferase family protein [Beduini massiliensis]